MGRFVTLNDDIILDRTKNVIGFQGSNGQVVLLTAEYVRKRLGYAHLRHIYWLVEQGHLPYRKFGRELVFTETDIQEFLAQKGQRYYPTSRSRT